MRPIIAVLGLSLLLNVTVLLMSRQSYVDLPPVDLPPTSHADLPTPNATARLRFTDNPRVDVSHLSEECRNWLSDQNSAHTSFASQFGQDWWFNYNIFRNKKNGFYIDVGANNPKFLSNSYFFDKCLGWQGICVEANPRLAKILMEERSCKVVSLCASDSAKRISFRDSGYQGVLGSEVGIDDPLTNIRDGNVIEVECQPLSRILHENHVQQADVLFLDIEGGEINALKSIDFETVKLDYVVVENNLNTYDTQDILFDAGYKHIYRLGPDEIYERGNQVFQGPADLDSRLRKAQAEWLFENSGVASYVSQLANKKKDKA